MKNFFIFVLTGLLFSLPGEVLNQITFHRNPGGFVGAAVVYIIFLSLVYAFTRLLRKQLRKPFSVALVGYCIVGFVGLMIEWFLIHNSPWQHPEASQIAMFTFWASLFIGPLIVMDNAVERLAIKKGLLRYFIVLSLAYNIIAITGNTEKYIGAFIFTYGTWALNYFFIKYLLALS